MSRRLENKNETVIKTKRTLNHDRDHSECKAKEVENQIERKAQYSTTRAIANEIFDDYAIQLPMPKKDLLRAVPRKRQRVTPSNTCPN